jgi:hypothetical protein
VSSARLYIWRVSLCEVQAVSGHGRGQLNAVVLGGDVHENWVGYIKRDSSDPDSETLASGSRPLQRL